MIQYLSDSIGEIKMEKDILKGRLKEIKEEIKTKNTFADSQESHQELAFEHLERI